jgi:hypothetical protein
MAILQGILGTLGELLRSMWLQRMWWLIPVVLGLFLCAALIILGNTTGVGPFIYTIF